jgi:diguanylate cyclase (GGDEF)-like protein
LAGASTDFKTILVLDDDPLFHRLIVPVLTNRGHRVLSAHTAKEATTLVSNNKIDLAIVDGQLPDANGINWIAEFRSAGNDALTMFVSAHWRDAQSYHRLTKELGVTLVLHKPILAAVFAAEVDMILGKGSAGQETTDFEDTLLALRTEYARELPARMEEMVGLLSQLRADPANNFLHAEARTHAHKLRGTAASYGFRDIGEHAAQIEEKLIELKTRPKAAQELFKEIDLNLLKAQELTETAVAEYGLQEPILKRGDVVVESSAIAKILLVDDDAAFLDLVDELARERELEVMRASNPDEALDMACMAQVDAALIDVELGHREVAFKLAADLRSLPGYSDLPLAFLSGSGHIEETSEIDSVGQCLYIPKPMKADALQGAVRQLVAIRHVTRPRVLLIDDDVDFARRIAFVLTHEGIEVQCINNTEDILRDMQRFAPDAVLLDVMMPGVSGFDICRMLRTIPRWRDIPITFLTAYSDIDTRIACLRCGGDDYLIKPVVNEELMLRLNNQLERARLLKQRLEHDAVSGLLLREPFMRQLSTMISEAHRQSWNVAIAFGQLEISRTEDALVSDTVLSAAGALLSKRLRAEDLKGYWGDEKLLLAFRNEDISTVNGLIAKVSDELAQMQLPASPGQEFSARIHFGVAQFPTDGDTVHELLTAADRRLQDSKRPPAGKRVKA